MSYYTSRMTGEQKLKKYERERAYRAERKCLCLVIPKDAFAIIKEHANMVGASVTSFMLDSAMVNCEVMDRVYDKD